MKSRSNHGEKTTVEPAIPDGGYGWVITAASFMCHFVADGIAFSFGVIYSDLLNTFGSSKSATSWIASLSVGIPLISGPVAGLFVTRYGCRPAAMMGGLITSAGMLLSTFATSIEMLTFTYGVMAGFGLAFIYVPASVIPSFWFEEKRSLATGIAVAGSGLGTFAMAPLVEYLLEEYGWRGTMLVMSAITLNFLVFGALFREAPHMSRDAGPLNQKVIRMDSLPSVPSVVSLEDLEDNDTPDSPVRLYHSTNTICAGEQFDLQHGSINPQIQNIPGKRNPKSYVSVAQLLRSKQSLLPLSRHDITSVMNLAMRQRTISSCPDLSISTDDEKDDEARDDDDDGKHFRKASKKRSTGRVIIKARHIITEMCDVRLLAVPVYLLFFISNFMLSYAYDLPYLYIPDYAATLGIDRPSFLIAIIGIVKTFGQVLFGYLGDRKCVDTLLLYGVSILLCGVLVSLLPLMHNYTSLAAFSVFFGLLVSASFSLETIVLVKILSLDQLTKAYGLLMFGQGVASLIGPPIGGFLCDITQEYVYTFIFTGLSIVVSGVLAISIFFVKKPNPSRSVSESDGIEPADVVVPV